MAELDSEPKQSDIDDMGKKKSDLNTTQIGVRVPPKLKRQIEAVHEQIQYRGSVSDLIRLILEKYVDGKLKSRDI